MRVAIIGSGISGLTAAWRLHQRHKVVVFEANDYIGGHTNTVDVELEQRHFAIDTGFIVFNDRTYPQFTRLLEQLDVDAVPTPMSFSVRSDEDNLEYNGSSLPGLFAQRRNLLRPSFYRMINDILRFNRTATELLDDPDRNVTVGEYLRTEGYSQQFADHYLLPMGASIWSCPTRTFSAFPMQFIVEFYHNHGLLSLRDRPTWFVIRGGSREYVRPLVRGFREQIRLNTPVRSVERFDQHVEVRTTDSSEQFDEVIFACHSDQALRILGWNATAIEKELLGAFPYEANTAVLHTDESVLPRRRKAWASWNYHIPRGMNHQATLTYNMNILQHVDSDHTFCVTLNEDSAIRDDRVLASFRYSHPIFTLERKAAQNRHSEVIRNNRTSFCGAYWGNGFHEDGVRSANAVADAFESQAAEAEQYA